MSPQLTIPIKKFGHDKRAAVRPGPKQELEERWPTAASPEGGAVAECGGCACGGGAANGGLVAGELGGERSGGGGAGGATRWGAAPRFWWRLSAED